MARLFSFRGLHPRPDLADQVCCLPHRVNSVGDGPDFFKANPLNFIRVVHAEWGFPHGITPHVTRVAHQAREAFSALAIKGALVRDTSQALYIYQVASKSHCQTGVVGNMLLDDYEQGFVKRHENTLPSAVRYRAALLREVRAHPGPVFVVFRAPLEFKKLLATEASSPPLVTYHAPDGMTHRLWRATRTDEIIASVASVPNVYIADGHHRVASAIELRADLQAADESFSPDFEYFLSALFPYDETRILPYHRIIRSASPSTLTALPNCLAEHYTIEKQARPTPNSKGEVVIYVNKEWFLLKPRFDVLNIKDAIEQLDVTLLQHYILEPIFNIVDQRIDSNIGFVAGSATHEHFEKLITQGEAACVFLVYPTSVEEMMAVADTNRTMAPKSTWFEPKLASGLIIDPIE